MPFFLRWSSCLHHSLVSLSLFNDPIEWNEDRETCSSSHLEIVESSVVNIHTHGIEQKSLQDTAISSVFILRNHLRKRSLLCYWLTFTNRLERKSEQIRQQPLSNAMRSSMRRTFQSCSPLFQWLCQCSSTKPSY